MADEDAAAPRKDARRGIQSVEIGFQLVNALAAARGKLPLKTLADRAGMSPSKAHLYLVSFQRLGIVAQDPVTSRYGLGPAALHLGISAIDQLDVLDVARDHMPRILEQTEASASLSVWGNRGPTIVFRLDSELPVPLSVRVGYVQPLMTTGTGRMFMAHLQEREWSDLAEAEARSRPDLLEQTRGQLAHIREAGIAITQNMTHSGFFGAAGPIFDSDNTICAVVTALGLSQATDLSETGRVATVVRETAGLISRDLGARTG
ncbi:IclR family transcriptional regulator [Amorphus coralli]|uniref:IclR family transcriptional regulator n=1 Tax=Amorphus coralli TaxID=340680 RepID=UPI000364E513|nr:IclR family transcriptional regulator [Amorphus coralli]